MNVRVGFSQKIMREERLSLIVKKVAHIEVTVGTMETESGKLYSVWKFDRISVVISLDEGRDYLFIFLQNCWSDLGKTSALIQYAQKISYICFLSILCLSLSPCCCLGIYMLLDYYWNLLYLKKCDRF